MLVKFEVYSFQNHLEKEKRKETKKMWRMKKRNKKWKWKNNSLIRPEK